MATKGIYRIKDIVDCHPFDHKEDLHAVFTREGILKRTIYSVWGCPGHLFVSLEGGTLIRAYQMKTTMPVKQFTLSAKISPVVQTSFTQDTHDLALFFHQNGTVKVYENFQPPDSNTQPWRKRAQFTLGTNVNDACVKSALYVSCPSNRLVWVEERKEKTSTGESRHFSLFTAEVEAYCKSIKAPVLLLSNCPTELVISVAHLGDCVAILPKHPNPAGMYFRLLTDTPDRSLELATSIVGEGCVQRNSAFPLDFVEHGDRLIHIWSKVALKPDRNLVAMAEECGSRRICLISIDGSVQVISQKDGETTATFQLADVDISAVSSWFSHTFMLGAVLPKDKMIRIYSSASGDLLQEVNLSPVTSAGVIHTWSMMGSVPQVGIWSKDGIWMLQMHDASSAAKADSTNVTEHLQSFGLDKMAASVELQRVHLELSKGASAEGAVGKEPNLDLLHDNKIFQNEALLLNILQEADAGKRPDFSEKLSALQQEFEERKEDAPDTSLNDSVLPLLHEFWQIEQQRDQAAQQTLRTRGGPRISIEVKSALNEDSPIPIDLRLGRLELLSQYFAERVLHCLLEELNLEKAMETDISPKDANPGSDDERPTPLNHSAMCSPDTDEGCRFLKLLCRLLFTYEPSKLVNVVDYFQLSHHAASDMSAFTRKRHGISISSLILDVLPEPTESADVKEAVRTQARLIQRSDKAHGAMRSLQLLLSNSMWADAVAVVRDNEKPDSQAHRELFHVLLCAILMDQTALEENGEELWECLPPSISALNLLQTLQINQDMVKNQLGRQGDSSRQAIQVQGLTTALLKEQLIKMLAQESA